MTEKHDLAIVAGFHVRLYILYYARLYILLRSFRHILCACAEIVCMRFTGGLLHYFRRWLLQKALLCHNGLKDVPVMKIV